MDDETITLLAESAGLANRYGLLPEATAITDALLAAIPDDGNVMLLQATTHLGARRYDEAASILRDKILANDPDNSTAKAFLGMALHLSGKAADRDKVLQEVIDSNDDEDAVTIAQSFLHL
jgi:predicted Zn-dependent protease